MIGEWLATSWIQAGLVALSTVCIYVAIIAVIRVNGLRSFSKMSSFDQATTIAVGTIFGSVAITSASLSNGAIALVVTFAMQKLIARNRASEGLRRVVDNQPRLLMVDGQFLAAGLKSARVTRHDVVSVLRQQGVTSLDRVAAVVLETTGDMAVIQSVEGVASVDPRLLDKVAGAEQFAQPLSR